MSVFTIDERRGFEWWTVGWGTDVGTWLKLGPFTFVKWTLEDLAFYELHCCNRLVWTAHRPHP